MNTSDKIFKGYGVEAVNLYFTGTCNLKCTYCFQPKIGSHMRDINNKIIEWITSGRMEDDIATKIGDHISSLCFWGGESTINIPYFVQRFPFIVERFKNFNSIDFSTNLAKQFSVDNIIELAETVLNYNLTNTEGRHIHIDAQISIDGVPEINDTARIGCSALQIMDNTEQLIEWCNRDEDHLEALSLSFKGTHGSESVAWMSKGNNLEKHFRFFDEYRAKWEQKGYKVFPMDGERVTFVYPGKYTVEDGKNLAKVMQIQLSDEFQNLNWKSSRKPSFENQLYTRVKSTLSTLKRGSIRDFKGELMGVTSCSACRGSVGLTYDGKVHWCHSTYFFDDDTVKYITENNLTTDFEENQGFSFRNFNDYVRDIEVVDSDDTLRLSRTLNLVQSFGNNSTLRTQFFTMILSELAASGQISECFLDKKWQDIAIAYLLYGGNECPANNVWEFGSIWVRSTSQMKLFFNGAFETIVKYLVENDKWNETNEL